MYSSFGPNLRGREKVCYASIKRKRRFFNFTLEMQIPLKFSFSKGEGVENINQMLKYKAVHILGSAFCS